MLDVTDGLSARVALWLPVLLNRAIEQEIEQPESHSLAGVPSRLPRGTPPIATAPAYGWTASQNQPN